MNIALWDPVVDLNDLEDLQKEGIKIYTSTPSKIEFAFLCVNHDEINNFLKVIKD